MLNDPYLIFLDIFFTFKPCKCCAPMLHYICTERKELVMNQPAITVGTLVRHPRTGGVGIVVEHTMYNAEWGGFKVQFQTPVDNVIDGRVVNQLAQIFDRADKFEAVVEGD